MMAQVFSASFLLVAPFWGLMIAAPRWRVTQRIVASPWIAAPIALLYVALIAPSLADVFASVAAPDLATISAALATPEGATTAWVHFLAFDLFVGRWIYLDAQPRAIPPLALAPILFFTLMLGPIGLLSYLLLRAWRDRRTTASRPAPG
jgi:hypothetical protein